MRDLLDENLPERLAMALRDRGVDVLHVRELGRGALSDEEQLAFAAEQGRVLVSRDYKYVPRLTRAFLQAGRAHAGVLLLPASIDNDDIGGSTAAIIAFEQEHEALLPYHLAWLRSAPLSPD